MRLLTLAQYDQLIQNGTSDECLNELIPVVKIYMPGTDLAWLLGKFDPENTNRAYCLFAQGDGFSCHQWVKFDELMDYETEEGMKVEVDKNFSPKFKIKVYQEAEWWFKRLVEDEATLKNFEIAPKGNQLSLL